MLNDLWTGLDRPRRAGLVAGAIAVVGLCVALAWWSLRADDGVLFADLAASDAAAMAAELDRQKVRYRLSPDGRTIYVARDAVPATRLKLMGRELPIAGSVGFELFNQSDFGMTEFAQKINYQRALQGELQRTIQSLAEVESARVHIALPEEGLFRRDRAKAKAAVTLGLRRGQSLRGDQVSGIQRLVAAAVPGIAAADVTIVDRQGIALTRRAEGDQPAADLSSRLELEQAIETALARKATRVLERAFGEGRALASVDVVLDMSTVRTTTEDVRGGTPATADGPATGVVVRERETLRDEPTAATGRDAARGATSVRETDYQVGRRVEQVVSQPGSVQRLHAVAIVQEALDGDRLAEVKALVAAAVGAQPARGDTVVVHAATAAAVAERAAAARSDGVVPASDGRRVAAADGDTDAATSATSATSAASGRGPFAASAVVAALAVAVAAVSTLVALGLFVAGRRERRARTLTAPEREAALTRVRGWLAERPAAGAAP